VRNAGFSATVQYVPSDQPRGRVVAQSPGGRTSAPTSAQVMINVSSGEGTVSSVQSAGLHLVMLRRTVTDHSEAGKVVAQTPAAVTTTSVPTTTPTTTPKPKKLILPVPDLVGRQWKDAVAGLRRAGFHVSFVTVPSALPRGSVTAQDPKAGAKVAKGSGIRLN